MSDNRKPIRVFLRGLEMDDHIKIHSWRQDEEIARNFGRIRLFSSSLNVQAWVERLIKDEVNVAAAICLKETGEFIGCIFLNEIDHHNRSGHCPVFIGEKRYWGQGLATDARILMLRYAFYERGLERIWAVVTEGNIGSLKMCEKTGHKIEGLMRNSKYLNGKFENQYILSVLRDEFAAVSENYEG